MTAAIARPQPHSDWLARIRTVGLALGGRGVMGLGLGRSSVQAAEASWWLAGGISAANAIAVYQPKGAASLAASYVNLANPGTYDAAPGVAPTFDAATGWAFNGSAYLNSGVTMPAGGAVVIRLANISWTNRYITGNTQGATQYLLARPTSGQMRYLCRGFNTDISSTPSTHVSGMTDTDIYQDGVDVGNLVAAAGTPSGQMLIGGLNNGGSPLASYVGNILAMAFYSTAPNAVQFEAISTAMAAL